MSTLRAMDDPSTPGAARRGISRPLRVRDFRLLWVGMAVSMVGDGIYVVAMSLQVLAMTNSATALAMVGLAWSAPQVVLMLASGALSDRLDRRRLMIAGDLVRLATIATIGTALARRCAHDAGPRSCS